MGDLNRWQLIVVVFWWIIKSIKFDTYKYWVDVGMQPKYAYEKALKIN